MSFGSSSIFHDFRSISKTSLILFAESITVSRDSCLLSVFAPYFQALLGSYHGWAACSVRVSRAQAQRRDSPLSSQCVRLQLASAAFRAFNCAVRSCNPQRVAAQVAGLILTVYARLASQRSSLWPVFRSPCLALRQVAAVCVRAAAPREVERLAVYSSV